MNGPAAGEYGAGYTSMVRREPLGIVGQIAPWNYPLMMAIWKIAPALAGGNTVVLKPSELTPVSTLRFAELVAEILPPGVLNVVTGDGPGVGEAIVRHPEIALVSLTGSVQTGKGIARAAADTLKRVHLELGGKAPVIVFDDADPKAVAAGPARRELPQLRPGLHRRLARARRARDLRGAAGGARPGGGVADGRRPRRGRRDRDGPGHLGPPAGARPGLPGPRDRRGRRRADRRQRRQRPRLLRAADGRRGRRPAGPRSSSARSSGRSSRSSACEDAGEAFALANDVPYGLAASVWTRDTATAMEAIRQLDFGCVWINDHLPFLSEMPHGGFKESGYGKDLSVYALEDYTRVKHAMIKLD